ncbi:MAG: hypothetical protein HY711_01490 [Candidatus Melainabacteria bacterium]|nr:hypothetical protein [Candidatus Melainabacteria bacterium]
MAGEDKGSSMGSYEDAPPSNPSGEEPTSLAARRAKLRGSLAKAVLPSSDYTPASMVAGVAPEQPDPAANLMAEPQLAPAIVPPEQTPDNTSYVLPSPTPVASAVSPAVIELLGKIDEAINACVTNLAALQKTSSDAKAPVVPTEAMELLTNLDQAMNACATNLAALQKIASEQTEVLKGLTDALLHQTLSEIGLNLNSLTESLSAALEPMKAVGELVPAIDQLVATIEAREAAAVHKISPDQLVTSLADQLSTGAIDSWTFKCAYTAVFPADHPADLLRRLVELLGTQRLSGDLFRSAYEAVQAAEPPPRQVSPNVSQSTPQTIVQVVQDEEIKRELEQLRHSNEELQKAMEEREGELEQLLAAKDQELQETQEMLNHRYEEFHSRYGEVTDALNKREEDFKALLENKDMAINEKEAELRLLREQMEELRSQTEEMVKELQKQVTDIKIAKEATSAAPTVPGKPAATANFFDTVPSAGRQSSLFDAAPEKPLFAPEVAPQPITPVQATPQTAPAQPVQPAQTPPQRPEQPAAQVASQSVAQQQASQQVQAITPSGAVGRPAVPTPTPTTPLMSGSGSYGSGVRAQVFEVIVRQALAGAPWKEICAGPMQVNNITPEEVESEVKRRQAMLNK